MKSRISAIATGAAAVLLSVMTLGSAGAAPAVAPAWRSGHPPQILSATVNAKRQLVVQYQAPDGVTYGGGVYFGSDPRNATPTGSPSELGQFMYCNNLSNCEGMWRLAEVTPATGPFTFTSPVLSRLEFPNGQYWVQVSTTNEDPYPSTRYWENSNIVPVNLTATGGGGPEDTVPPDTSQDFSFRYGWVSASRPESGDPDMVTLRVYASCPNAVHYQVHAELQTLSGTVIAEAVLQGRTRDVEWAINSKDVHARLPAKGFSVVGRNFVCWRYDSSQVVGYRGTFQGVCKTLPGPYSTRCRAKIPTGGGATTQ